MLFSLGEGGVILIILLYIEILLPPVYTTGSTRPNDKSIILTIKIYYEYSIWNVQHAVYSLPVL
jgi:hypothetical protein